MANPLEIAYPYVPVPIQNFGISLYGLFYRNERLGGNYRKHVEGFLAREHYSPEQMRQHVDERLGQVLLRAHQHVPYYRNAWAASRVNGKRLSAFTVQDLPQLPITPKEDLRSRPLEFVAQDIPTARQLKYFTSGTSGTPITAIYTQDAHRQFLAAREARSFSWAGVGLNQPRSMMGGRMVVPSAGSGPPYYRYNWAEKQVYFSAYHLRPATVLDYLEGFHKYRPEFMTGYAFSHFLLAKLLLDQGRTLDYQPKALVLSSEKLTADMKETIRKAFHARAYEEYGSVEQVALATECSSGSLHVSPDFGVVELLDDQDRPVPPGVQGRLVCTSLLNEAQPLVRYDTGDLAVWGAGSCSCGRPGLPVLQELVGRVEDSVILPDATELVRFHGIFMGLPNVIAGQIVQDDLTQLRVRVVAGEGFGHKDEELILRRMTVERLGNVSVTIERVSELERTSRGKIRGVISYIPESQRREIRNGKVTVV